ncbi:MAG: diguanylate cyclase [Mariprofundales bacterium]|nr:diguanylate cyclase [Mariprofundales bacterium]
MILQTVLIADDDSTARLRLSHFLTEFGYRVEACLDGNAVWEKICAEDAPKLLILDWMMPGLNGLELCRRLRQREQEQGDGDYHYILLLTARNETGDLIEGMNAGADDYLTKPFNKGELRVRLRAGRRILELQQQLLEARDRFEKAANTDPLTGANNRGSIERLLNAELDRARRNGQPLAVVMLDIDFFKKVNDTFGHLAGDEVLRETVRRLQAELRIYDHLGRYGGEEFLLIFPGDNVEGARGLAERLRQAIANAPVNTSAGLIETRVSVGVCVVPEGNSQNVEALVGQADVMLYQAKDGGRNRVELTIAATE